ncbi:MAG: hypothetical protein AB1631_27155 [Acidobacteriota bacterium]
MKKVCRQTIALVIVVSILSCTSVFAANRSRSAASPAKSESFVSVSEANKTPQPDNVAADNAIERRAGSKSLTVKSKFTNSLGAKPPVRKVAAKNIRVKEINVVPGQPVMYVVQEEGGSWDCMVTCLQSAGVSLVWILGCAAICIVTAGIGCAICLGVGAGVVTICGEACAHALSN